MKERFYKLALALAPGVGEKRFFSLIKYFGSGKAVWGTTAVDFEKLGLGKKVWSGFEKWKSSFDPAAYTKSLAERQIKFVVYDEDIYPPNLARLKEKPPVLFFKGSFENINWNKAIAVVGTRKMTAYGRIVTEKIVSNLALNGFTIISGLALGVDALAHKTALLEKGKTVAVLGSGVDLCYPKENEFLYNKIIQKNGAVVSQFLPGILPSFGTFPARNRIIAGLSVGVLVTEAGEDSGALITANWAKEMGRPVFAVPGPINVSQSKGALSLLKQGAVLVDNPDDILHYFKVKNKKLLAKSYIKLSIEEKKIIDLLEEELTIDSLARKSGIEINKLNILLSELELKGAIRNLGNGKFEKNI